MTIWCYWSYGSRYHWIMSVLLDRLSLTRHFLYFQKVYRSAWRKKIILYLLFCLLFSFMKIYFFWLKISDTINMDVISDQINYRCIYGQRTNLMGLYLRRIGLYTGGIIFGKKNTLICNLLNLLLFFFFPRFGNNQQPQMVGMTSQTITTCWKWPIETPEQHCVEYVQIRPFFDPRSISQSSNLISEALAIASRSTNCFHIFQLLEMVCDWNWKWFLICKLHTAVTWSKLWGDLLP